MKKREFRPVVDSAKLEDRVTPTVAPFAHYRWMMVNTMLNNDGGGLNTPGYGGGFAFGGRYIAAVTNTNNNVITAIGYAWSSPVQGKPGTIPNVAGRINNYLAAGPGTQTDAISSINSVALALNTQLPQGLASAAFFALPRGRGMNLNAMLARQLAPLQAQLRTVQTYVANPANAATAVNDLAGYYAGFDVPGAPAGTANLLTPGVNPDNTFGTGSLEALATQNVQTAQNFLTPPTPVYPFFAFRPRWW